MQSLPLGGDTFYGCGTSAHLRIFTDMGNDKQNKPIIKKLGQGMKEVTGPPPDDLPERMKELLEQLQRK